MTAAGMAEGLAGSNYACTTTTAWPENLNETLGVDLLCCFAWRIGAAACARKDLLYWQGTKTNTPRKIGQAEGRNFMPCLDMYAQQQLQQQRSATR